MQVRFLVLNQIANAIADELVRDANESRPVALAAHFFHFALGYAKELRGAVLGNLTCFSEQRLERVGCRVDCLMAAGCASVYHVGSCQHVRFRAVGA